MEVPPKLHFLYDLVLPKVEWLSWPLATLGLGLLYAGVPAGSTLLMVGLGTLALLFFLGAYQPVPTPDAPASGPAYVPVTLPGADTGLLALVAAKIQGIASAVTLIGVLFKLLFWQGSAPFLLVGVLTLGPMAAWQLATGRRRRRAVVVAALGLATWLTPTATLVRQFYRDDPALVAAVLYQQQHPRDRAAAQQVRQLLQARRQRQRRH